MTAVSTNCQSYLLPASQWTALRSSLINNDEEDDDDDDDDEHAIL